MKAEAAKKTESTRENTIPVAQSVPKPTRLEEEQCATSIGANEDGQQPSSIPVVEELNEVKDGSDSAETDVIASLEKCDDAESNCCTLDPLLQEDFPLWRRPDPSSDVIFDERTGLRYRSISL